MSLKTILDSATPGPWSFDCQPHGQYVIPMVDGPVTKTLAGTSMVVIHEYVPVEAESESVHNARLIALAPELAQLALDMGEFIGGEMPDDECDVPGCTDPWCCDHDAYALLARLDAIGKPEDRNDGKETT